MVMAVARQATDGSYLLSLVDDQSILVVMHGVLAGVLAVALFATGRARWKASHNNLKAVVTRGAESMKMLYVTYGIVTAVFTFAIPVSVAATGFKSALILVDYVVLSYLFFFNAWFRNWLLGRLGRVRED